MVSYSTTALSSVLPSELRLLLAVRKDLVSRVSFANPTSPSNVRYFTFAQTTLEQASQLLTSLILTPAMPKMQPLEQPTAISYLVPVLLLDLSLLASNADVASQVLKFVNPFAATVDNIHRRYPALFDPSSPMSVQTLIELDRMLAQLLAVLLSTLYNGDALKPEETLHRQLFAPPIFSAACVKSSAAELEQQRSVLRELLAKGDEGTGAPASLAQWLRKRTARSAPLPQSAEPFGALFALLLLL